MQTTIAHDEDSLALATSADDVDGLNAEFYGAIRFPGPPILMERLKSTRFWADAMDQELGRRGDPVLPGEGARIWVAGCGTNQAVITALMFPDAQVVGSDLSAPSLAMAGQTARQLGVRNLELRNESIHTAYEDEFDYVICTGVIHHNADPGQTLQRLAAALRPEGVMQMMVYNRYHRAMSTAFQKMVRALLGDTGYAYEKEVAMARRFVDHFAADDGPAGESAMGPWLATYADRSDAELADSLVQPVEHSYTVESLDELGRDAGLEMLAPYPNQFDAAKDNLDWELELGDPELQAAYDALPDVRRWQVTNLFTMNKSPMLWFYMQRQDSPYPRRTTRELCDAFLAGRHVPTSTTRQVHLCGPGGTFKSTPDSEFPFPVLKGKGDARRVYEALDPKEPLGATMERLGIDTGNMRLVNRLRMNLASTAFPLLKAI